MQCNAHDDIIKCNTQTNYMAKTANNWRTPGASNPGRYIEVLVIYFSWCGVLWINHMIAILYDLQHLIVSMSFSCMLHFIMSSCALHCIHVRLMHPSIFPVVHFAIRHSYALRRSPFVSLRERVLNILGMARGFSSGLGIAPVDRLSSFVPFGGRLLLQRLTG